MSYESYEKTENVTMYIKEQWYLKNKGCVGLGWAYPKVSTQAQPGPNQAYKIGPKQALKVKKLDPGPILT